MKRKTNVQFVKRQMEYARSGALAQAFLLEAIRYYADTVLSTDVRNFDGAFFSAEAWRATAKEWKDAVEDHLKC